MKTFLKNFVLLLALGLSMVQCSDDVLEVTNPNEIGADNFFQNLEQLELSLNSVYSAHSDFELYGGDLLPFGLYGMAKIGDQEFLNSQDRNEFYQNEVTTNNGLVRNYWRSFYRGIARANDFLSQSETYLESPDVSAENRARVAQMQGEALFYRALNYFHLVRLWGVGRPVDEGEQALGVPLILEVAPSREDTNVPRATVGEVYTQMVEDLQAAANALPDAWSGDDLARADAFAARALLAQVYTYSENYTEATLLFEEIVDGPFDLVPFENYQGLFNGENEFSSESLFELNISVDLEENTWLGGTGSNVALILAPIGTGWSNNYPHDVNVRRFGEDPRLKISMYEPGVDSVPARNETILLNRYVDDEGALGWSFKKYVRGDASIFTSNRNFGANFNIIRLADIYLMYAEVLNAQGEDALASEFMNRVRRRAYGGDPEVPNPEVDYLGFTGTRLRDSIREERFRELFAEGHRWYDLQRWRIAEEELAKYPGTRSGPIIFDPKDYYLPIPQGEVDQNSNMVQSPGY